MGSTVSGNEAAHPGGGISNSGGQVWLTKSILSGNRATYGGCHGAISGTHGGGISNFGGQVWLTKSTLSGNSAGGVEGTGGGIVNVEGSLTLNDSTVTASSDGGISNHGSLTLNDSTVSANNANETASGPAASVGGILNGEDGSLTLNDSTVSGNTGPFGGIENRGVITLTRSTVTGNNGTGSDGNPHHGVGGVWNDAFLPFYQGSVTLNDSTVSGNTADGRGGGIFNTGLLTLNNSHVTGNTAQDGGGIDNWAFSAELFTGRGSLTLNGSSTVTGNEASEHGGGIYNHETKGATISYGPGWSGTVSGNKPDDIFNE